MVGALVILIVPASAGSTSWWPGQAGWVETAHITPDDAHEPSRGPSHWGVHFGAEVAMDGDTVVVGTQLDRHKDGTNTASGDGADWAYVFERYADGRWFQADKLIPDDAHEGDTFAFSLDVDEEAGVVVAGNPKAERIYIFERQRGSPGGWTQVASFDSPVTSTDTPARFGYDVAVSGDTVLTGRNGSTLFIHERIDGIWTRTGTAAGGTLVAIEGQTLVTAHWDREAGRGHFLVYGRSGDSWVQHAILDPAAGYDNEATQPSKVAISANEDKIILGAPIDRRVLGVDMESHGLGLNAVGSAWIYELAEGEWIQTADLPNPMPAPTASAFGHAVGIDGELAVVGAPWSTYNGGGPGSGAAFVYQKLGDEWILVSNLRNHDNGPYGGGDVFGKGIDVASGRVVVGAPFDDQRRDGVPAPVDDDGDIPPCLHRELMWGCDEGENAGSVYIFEAIQDVLVEPGG